MSKSALPSPLPPCRQAVGAPARSSLVLMLALFWLGSLSGCAAFKGSGTALTYQVGPYQEYGTFFLPAVAPSSGRGPAVVLLHGGFFGDDAEVLGMGQELARRGVLAVVPTYRGEKRRADGLRSQGRIEFCQGEVEDVAVLVQRLRERPDVDPTRIGLIGFSHGGCIGLRVAENDPAIAVLVTFSAPTDAPFTYQNLSRHPLQELGFDGWLGSRLQAYVGGDTRTLPKEWLVRSPLAEALPPRLPVLLVHGTADHVVPVVETCWMRDALRQQGRQVTEEYFDHDGRAVAPYPVCDRAKDVPVVTAAWPPAEGGEAAPAQVRFYAGQDHGFGPSARKKAQDSALDFLVAHLVR